MNVEILMSTYNGEKYINEQLDSIITQSISNHITIRDDGSSDSTVKLLNNYKMVDLIKGSNVGSTESFFDLIELAPVSDFYAFSDQDDVWDEKKIERAISLLKKYDSIPAVYCGNTRLVDENLCYLKTENKRPKTNLGSAIVKNYATGCTMVFNGKLMNELKKYHPVDIPFHDWWVNLVCLSIGGVSIFDNEPYMSYRQHGNNVVGGDASILKKWQSRAKKFRTPYRRENIARQIIDNYLKEIPEDRLEILQDISDYKVRKKHAIFNKSLRTGSFINDLLFMICILSNKA